MKAKCYNYPPLRGKRRKISRQVNLDKSVSTLELRETVVLPISIKNIGNASLFTDLDSFRQHCIIDGLITMRYL